MPSTEVIADMGKDMARMAAAIESQGSTLKNFRDDMVRLFTAQDEFNRKLAVDERSHQHMAKDMSDLLKLVRDGNGQPSMVQRLTTLEESHKFLDEKSDSMQVHLNNMQTAKVMGKTQFWALLFVGVTTALSVVGTMLSQMFR